MKESIAGLVRAHVQDAEVKVHADGNHFQVAVTSPAFAGLSRVRRQQLVYQAIGELIRDGSVHAVTIRAVTPEEARESRDAERDAGGSG
ncbi:MAG: BolA/IbaG family iron-sulfur metabolism protein [Gammaproteobacteria bacterium]|nr:BolA/IbaG family iron-sulfur metabolism protein [Gammaproteobacteria bacterium]MYE82811.1 BolA/IbaG family iron-sulfur metabolism protein [Gammaproteobacteria bacterium]